MERGVDDRVRHRHLAQRDILLQGRQRRIIHRRASERHHRIGGELVEVGPVHEGLARQCREIDRVSPAEIAERGRQIRRREPAHPALDIFIDLVFLFDGPDLEMLLLAIDHQAEALLLRDDLLQRKPPWLADAVRKRGRYVERERHVVPRQDRIGGRDEILVGAVEGQRDEAPPLRHDHRAAADLVHGHEIIFPALQRADGPVEESRRDLVRLSG